MQKRILYTIPDGRIAIIVPAPAARLDGESDEAFARRIAAKDVPAGLAFEIVDEGVVPTDRTFRDAWERNGSAVGVSLVKAKVIAHDRRRAARAIELAPLDIEATIPAKAATAEAARQVIRDKYATMQTAIDACSSASQLKAVIAGL